MSTVLLAATLAVPALVLAGEARVGSATLRSTPFATTAYGPGVVSGQATLVTNAGTGTTSVTVRVEGLRPGTTHIAHIHFGDAAESSSADIADCEWWVAVHERPANATPQTPAIAIGPVRFLEPGS